MRIYNSIGEHGIISRQELLRQGAKQREINAAEADGLLTRIDRSRYAFTDTPDDVLAAASADATLTCVSALALHGIWTMPTSELHLRRKTYGARKRVLPANARLCSSLAGSVLRPVDSVPDALLAVIRHHPHEESIMAMDCLLQRRIYSRPELSELIAPAGVRGQLLLSRADALCESPLESIVRQRLRAAGLRPRLQVKIDGIGRVDMKIGSRLIVELDGIGFHDAHSYHVDRQRDRIAVREGYTTIRITWHQVLRDWDSVLDDLLTIVRSRKHTR